LSAGLLADQHHLRVLRAFAEYGLVASFQSGQARQSAASSRNAEISSSSCLRLMAGSVAARAIGRAGGIFDATDQRLNQRSLRWVPPLQHFGWHLSRAGLKMPA